MRRIEETEEEVYVADADAEAVSLDTSTPASDLPIAEEYIEVEDEDPLLQDEEGWVTGSTKSTQPSSEPHQDAQTYGGLATVASPLPSAPESSKLAHYVKPNGHWNQRIVIVGLAVMIAIIGFGLTAITDPQPANIVGLTPQGQSAQELTGPQVTTTDDTRFLQSHGQETFGSAGSGNLTTSGSTVADVSTIMGASGNSISQPAPSVPTIPTYLPPATRAANPTLSVASPTESTHVDLSNQEPFVRRMRAGQRTEEDMALAAPNLANKIEQDEVNQQGPKVVLPRGTRIPMLLLEPVRSGIGTTASARVLIDVRDVTGKVLLNAGSIAHIPFIAQEINGRVINNRSDAGFITLKDGNQVGLSGTVKGPDGFAGLTGTVKKIGGGSRLGRLARGAVRGVGSVVSTQLPSASGADVDDAISDPGSGIAPSERVVEVPSGTRFVFTVGL